MFGNNQQFYREWVQGLQELPLFFQPWWLDIVCGGAENWGVLIAKNKKSDEVEGIFTYYSRKRLGLRGIDMPPLTPMMGPLIFLPDNSQKQHSIYSYEIRVLKKLLAAL